MLLVGVHALVRVTRLNAAFRLEFLDQYVKPAHSRRLARCSERPGPGWYDSAGVRRHRGAQDAPRPRLAVVPSELVYRPLEEVGPRSRLSFTEAAHPVCLAQVGPDAPYAQDHGWCW